MKCPPGRCAGGKEDMRNVDMIDSMTGVKKGRVQGESHLKWWKKYLDYTEKNILILI